MKYVVKVLGYTEKDNVKSIVMELGDTDLHKYVKDNKFKSDKERISCLLQIAKGIQEMHMLGIVNRDIKVGTVYTM